jgi:hypothetical protein
MATHLAVPQHAWQGYDLMADAENIPVVSNLNGASKVVGSNRPTFPSYFSSGAGFDPMMTADQTKHYSSASATSIMTSDPMVASCASSSSTMNTADENDFSLFSAPPSSLLKKNNSLPPPPFSSFSYFSFSFLNEFMQQTQGAAALPFAPVPPAKYTSALNQQPQHYPRAEPLRERRTPSPPPAAAANYGPATTVLPLPQASAAFHHQQQQYFHHQQQQLQLQHQAALRQQQQQYHQAQIQAQAQQQVPVYRQESPLLPTPDYHHQQQHFAIHHAQQPQYQPHQPQQYQQQSQAQQAQQPPVQEVYERRESYSDGEYDQSGSDSDGYCGPHESPQVKAAFKNFLRQFKRKEKVPHTTHHDTPRHAHTTCADGAERAGVGSGGREGLRGGADVDAAVVAPLARVPGAGRLPQAGERRVAGPQVVRQGGPTPALGQPGLARIRQARGGVRPSHQVPSTIPLHRVSCRVSCCVCVCVCAVS